ncbi:hypothetical protein Kpol_167p2 [Vanderwaltozyma polyspora DSM 70294]|uniref:F-box domain-containing protein n=1 Tax=Vanderwaltozyma polyspora (strain ATCC 22028 / DSM 70294 / BCRC 21397 / CBS 2163 / NBRC 10782 / NRRL Y-8283 / UCD 57-17) TaxID=436907 RepID=A7TTS7_VANPO|nr:uncharacterized protein Kpol_167p2 [Vanderwaltozyma polyspora DSM 70294]EDO14329.1 hypothetical protein Kpol_167p2 [Vanderwaltozyma polyspora DSM 70294]
MKGLQFFGKSRNSSLNNDRNQESTQLNTFADIIGDPDDKIGDRMDSKEISLLSLPSKILFRILESLDYSTLLSLCVVNSKFYNLVSNHFLYKDVVLDSKLSLLKFNAVIHSEFHTVSALKSSCISKTSSQNIRFLVKSIEFVNPQSQDSLLKYSAFYKKDNKDLIGGTFCFDPSGSESSSYKRSSSNTRKNESSSSLMSPLAKLISNGNNETSNSRTPRNTFRKLDKWESKYVQYTYIELMLDIIDYLPNLRHIIISNIEPNFKIPLWYSVFNDGSRDFFKKIMNGQQSMNIHDLRTFEVSTEFVSQYEKKFYSLRRVKTVELRASNDSNNSSTSTSNHNNNSNNNSNNRVQFKPNLICCFGIIDELKLTNFTIDKESLDTPLEFVPLHFKINDDGIYDLHSTIRSLTLDGCHIVPGNGILRLFHDYFKDTKDLSLLNMTSRYDLLLSNCFSSLKNLTIDCSSEVFTKVPTVNDNYYYTQDQSDNNQQNLEGNDTETLLDLPVDNSLQAAPPTSAVVLALDLGYIPRKQIGSATNSTLKFKPALLTKSQAEFFKRLKVPEFHSFYHYNKNLWDRIPCKNVNINLINIPFTNVFPLAPDVFWEHMILNANDDQDTLIALGADHRHESNDNEISYIWNNQVKNCISKSLENILKQNQYSGITSEEVLDNIDSDMINNFNNLKFYKDIPNLNLWCFLKYLSKFKSVRISMLRKWLFCTPRSRYDWELLFKPVLNVRVPIEVKDRDGFVLYSYGEKITGPKV